MARRFLVTIGLFALGAAAWWIAHDGRQPDAGLVVHVELVDQAGAPVAPAQVERVFEGTRVNVGEDGRARIAALVLRERDEPGPEAIARALRVHAPFHALPRGATPDVERRADGSWSLRARLRAHGVLRLHVAQTHHGGCKAFLETRGQGERWEAIGGRQVARDEAPASYRVFADADAAPLVVRIEGTPDRDGAIGVATRKLLVAPPPLGHVAEKVIEPEPVMPILGRIAVGDGPTPPSLAGVIRVTELTADDARIPLAEIDVQPDGSFIARRTGAGRYELEADLDFFPGRTRLVVNGGASFDLSPAARARWVTLEHAGVDLETRAVAYVLDDADGAGAARRALFGEGRSHLALLREGAATVALRVSGTAQRPPLEGRTSCEAPAEGEVRAPIELAPAPSGTIVVETADGVWEHTRGGTLHLGGRRLTLMRGLRQSLTVPHVRAGPVAVRIVWDDPSLEAFASTVELAPGATARVRVEAIER